MTLLLVGPAVIAIYLAIWNVDRRSTLLLLPSAIFLAMVAISFLMESALLESQERSTPGGRVWAAADMALGRQLVCFASLGAAAGVCLVVMLRGRLRTKRTFHDPILRANSRIFAMLSFLGIALFVAIYGVGNLWMRREYIPAYHWPRFGGFAGLLQITSFLLALLQFRWNQGVSRVIGALLMGAGFVVAFSVGSRIIAVLPVVVIAVLIATKARTKVWMLCAAVYMSLIGLHLSLSNRLLDTHGLRPYLSRLLEFPSNLLLDMDALVRALSNVLFAIPLSSVVAESNRFTLYALGVSLDPRRGSAIGWGDLAGDLMVHDFIPYNGIGQLGSISSIVLIVICALFGAIATWVHGLWVQKGHWLVSTSIIIVYLYLSILLLQYNLRSSARFVWLLLALGLLSYVRMPVRSYKSKVMTIAGKG